MKTINCSRLVKCIYADNKSKNNGWCEGNTLPKPIFDCRKIFGKIDCNEFFIDWTKFIIFRKFLIIKEDKD